MINSMRLTKPYLDGTVEEQYSLDGGFNFTSLGVISRALASREENLLFPSLDTINYISNDVVARLRITLPEARAVDRIALEGITLDSGVTVSVFAGDGTTMTEVVAATALPHDTDYETSNMLFRFTERTSDTVYDIDFHDVSQAVQLTGALIGALGWEPYMNFDWGSRQQEAAKMIGTRTETANFFRVDDLSRKFSLNFSNQTRDKCKELVKFVSRRIANGYCLFELDQTDDEDWFLCTAQAGELIPEKAFNYKISLTVTELEQWL